MSCNMSDDDRDIENDTDVEDDDLNSSRGDGPDSMTKRAHHNALERKRRDHIKDSFTSLRDCVPALVGEKSSRAQILKKASDYIDLMKRKIQCHQQDIDLLIRQNDVLGQQVKTIQKTKYTGNFAAMSGEAHDDNFLGDEEGDEGEEEEEESEEEEVVGDTPAVPQAQPKRKKLRR